MEIRSIGLRLLLLDAPASEQICSGESKQHWFMSVKRSYFFNVRRQLISARDMNAGESMIVTC